MSTKKSRPKDESAQVSEAEGKLKSAQTLHAAACERIEQLEEEIVTLKDDNVELLNIVRKYQHGIQRPIDTAILKADSDAENAYKVGETIGLGRTSDAMRGGDGNHPPLFNKPTENVSPFDKMLSDTMSYCHLIEKSLFSLCSKINPVLKPQGPLPTSSDSLSTSSAPPAPIGSPFEEGMSAIIRKLEALNDQINETINRVTI